ncbi:hypothetical protein ATZ36_05090 [Candidatus Endomicrobiellum trichonymphae]|uniref:Uncharacterized protein n=1 Tax=Endomicrobium trichonymphae TaxID=1408204 RepID=A0A1E5IIF6_ENDTX|nr:hypothetical protein ATZ36_05115 [Candidatus Endomicrobium trichonymphae]OEG70291.1 hypothetical protein ATZ36_05090 [Candidatus Endomicrobium trichonymphae]
MKGYTAKYGFLKSNLENDTLLTGIRVMPFSILTKIKHCLFNKIFIKNPQGFNQGIYYEYCFLRLWI